jgi:signal transduction histidine kinase
MVASANEESERLLATLNKLLDLSRAESGTPQLCRLPVDLGATVRRAAGLAAAAAAERGSCLEITPSPPDLPEVSADKALLDEVLNILARALRKGDRRSPRLRLAPGHPGNRGRHP